MFQFLTLIKLSDLLNFSQFEVTTLIPKELIEVLQQSGTHTIEELQDKIDFNTTLPLPESPSVLGLSLIDLFKVDL